MMKIAPEGSKGHQKASPEADLGRVIGGAGPTCRPVAQRAHSAASPSTSVPPPP
jgi:hypothetical protein